MKPRKLTKLQEVEIWAWWRARHALGSFKTKAAEMEISEALLKDYVIRLRREHGVSVPKTNGRSVRVF